MPLSNFLQDVGGASYNPQVNAYGVNAQGVPVDKNGVPTSLYTKPSWFERLSPDVRAFQDQNAQYSANPMIAQQALIAQEQQAKGLPVAQSQGAINAAQLVGSQSPGTVGMMSGLGTFNPSSVDAYNSLLARNNSGFYPAQAGAETAQAGTVAAQNPSGAYSLIGQNVMREQGNVVPSGQMSQEIQNLYPGIGSSALNIGSINPQTGTLSSIPNPVRSLQGVLLGNALGGLGGGNALTTPSGNTYIRPQQQVSVPPIGQVGYNALNSTSNETPNTLPASGNIRPLSGLAGYQIDDDGNVFHNGTYVPEEQIKGTPLEKVVNHQLGLEKEVKNFHSTKALPHGLGFELGQTGRSLANAPYGPVNTVKALGGLIGRGYHGLIGE
jgi:hypothetical protein